MDHDQLIQVLKRTAIGIHKLLGNDTEVVLHDLTKQEVVYIVNGEISNRDMSYRINLETSNAIAKLADSEGHLIGLNQKSQPVECLRSSHFVYYGDDGKPSALICINQDMTKVEDLRNYLNQILRPLPQRGDPVNRGENYILKMTRQIIVDTMDTFSSAELATKEGKLRLLTKLYEAGIFSVRDSVSIICKSIGISNSSLYNYIKELNENGIVDKETRLPTL